jgi:hypothetical protein
LSLNAVHWQLDVPKYQAQQLVSLWLPRPAKSERRLDCFESLLTILLYPVILAGSPVVRLHLANSVAPSDLCCHQLPSVGALPDENAQSWGSGLVNYGHQLQHLHPQIPAHLCILQPEKLTDTEKSTKSHTGWTRKKHSLPNFQPPTSSLLRFNSKLPTIQLPTENTFYFRFFNLLIPQVTFFLAIFIMTERRITANRIDCCCCVTASSAPAIKPAAPATDHPSIAPEQKCMTPGTAVRASVSKTAGNETGTGTHSSVVSKFFDKCVLCRMFLHP